MVDDLVERSDQLAALSEAQATTLRTRRGAFVLLGGEAGSGKTVLLRRFCDGLPAVLWGSCDPLFTPRPLGPLIDLGVVTDGAKPYEIASALARTLAQTPGAVVVVEDLHWADEATIDVLSLLVRRLDGLPALIIATYREDELARFHPLRRLLGGIAAALRLTVGALSAEAVAVLAAPHGIDPAGLQRATNGNPFFVTEVVAAPGGDIPPTVRDAVLARASRLSAGATDVLEAVAVALPRAELWLLDALAGDTAAGLQECLDAGMLQVVADGVAFRHDLARQAVEQSLPPHRRRALHRRAVDALTGGADLPRLAHHAEAAGDTDAVLRFAPAAARHAASIGAHREAADLYARALRFGATLPARDRAALLESHSYACYLTDQMDASVETLEQAIALWRAAGDRVREGAALAQLARQLWCVGRTEDGTRVGDDAVHLLEDQPPGPELAFAYGVVAATHLNDERFDETVRWGERALALAEAHADTATIAHSLNTIATMRFLAGLPDGPPMLERSLALAQQSGLEDHVGRAFIHVGWAMTRTRAYQLVDRLDRGIEVCQELGLEAWELYVVAYRARAHLDLGRFDNAMADATYVLASARSVPLLRLLALTVVGLVRARRGEPDRWGPLDEAAGLLAGQTELQYRAPVAVARAEAAWLDGRGQDVDAITADVVVTAADRGAAWVTGEFAWLRRLACGSPWSSRSSRTPPNWPVSPGPLSPAGPSSAAPTTPLWRWPAPTTSRRYGRR